ncbi:MAG: Na+/H+ antiporter [Mesorhizobium sp.]
MDTVELILILVAAVIGSQPLGRLLPFVPMPILQIAIGVALAWPVTGGVHVELEPELFLMIFIPPLLFNDAWRAPKREFWRLRYSIASMAFGLVFFTIAAFGYALHWFVPAVPLVVAFAAAAVLSPTDAVAVSSIIDKDRLPPNLLHLLEGESLLNDASGLVMFRFAVAAALTGAFSLAAASWAFVLAVAGGIAAGFICLWIGAKALKILAKASSGSAEAQVLVIVLLPFLAYALAERWNASGVLAAVFAGLFLARWGLFRHLNTSARMLAVSTWQVIGFTLNGAIFVFLGLQLPAIARTIPPELTNGIWLQPFLIVLTLTLCLMVLRFGFILVTALIGRMVSRWRGERYQGTTLRMKLAATVAGVRGAVTLAGVMSLPLLMNGEPFPARDLVIFLATGVIFWWLIIAWLLLPALTRNLGDQGHGAATLELKMARIATAKAAIARLESIAGGHSGETGAATPRQAVAEGLIAGYRRRIAALEQGESLPEEARAEQRAQIELRQAATEAEQEALRAMLMRGEINDHTTQRLYQELTLDQATLATKTRA